MCNHHYSEWRLTDAGQCSIEHCSRSIYRRGMCGAHYRNVLKNGIESAERDAYVRLVSTRRDSRGRKQCTTCRHWKREDEFNRIVRTGDGFTPSCRSCMQDAANEAYAKRKQSAAECSTPGCKDPAHTKVRGLCIKCEYRNKTGQPLSLPKRGRLDFPVGISHAHKRVTALWGKATLYPCIECGRPAAQWAYDGTDPTEMLGWPKNIGQGSVGRYSRYPEFYMPMCKKCHARRDAADRVQELSEYRWFKSIYGSLARDLILAYLEMGEPGNDGNMLRGGPARISAVG